MAKSKPIGGMLTMMPGPRPGSWEPSSSEDLRLLARVQRPRDGDPANHPDRDKVAFLVALCASRGVSVIFDPSRRPAEAPSPPPRPGQGGRLK